MLWLLDESPLDVALRPDGRSTLITVRVVPRASVSAVAGVREGAVRIRVAAPPTDGKANAALRTFLARALGLRARDVTIVSGERSREKVLRLSGMAPEEVAARLQTP